MKKKQAQKLLDQTIFEFGDVLADILFEAQHILYTFKAVQDGEIISFDKKTNRYIHTSIVEWSHSVLATDLSSSTNPLFTLGGRWADRTSVVQRLPKTLNAECRWLLVSAYEAYERFLGQLYAVSGYCDRNLWRCADYGNDRAINQISEMTLNDFRDRVKKCKELSPTKIRKLLAHRFKIQITGSNNSKTETMTHSEHIDLIALMRHIIVHEQSVIDPNEFFTRLEKQWGRTGPITEKLKNKIMRENFKQFETEWNIWLVEHSTTPIQHINARRLEILIQDLGSHACIQYKKVVQYFGHAPYWERAQ